MTLNDPLANALSTVMLSEKAGKTVCVVKPVSQLIRKVLTVLNEQTYMGTYTEVKDRKGNILKLNLLGSINACGVVKPRFSVKHDGYEKYERRYLPARDMGVLIVSTTKGIMTNTDAKEKKLGGRVIAYCY